MYGGAGIGLAPDRLSVHIQDNLQPLVQREYETWSLVVRNNADHPGRRAVARHNLISRYLCQCSALRLGRGVVSLGLSCFARFVFFTDRVFSPFLGVGNQQVKIFECAVGNALLHVLTNARLLHEIVESF